MPSRAPATPPGPAFDDALLEQMAQALRLDASTGDTPGPADPSLPADAWVQDLDEMGTPGYPMSGLMESLMRQLLSKEMLHEPLREIAAKYPPWLAKARTESTSTSSSISEEDLDRYERQLVAIDALCRHYEADSEDFAARMALLQEMQDCGQPPEEIVRDLAPGTLFGAEGGGGGLEGMLPGGAVGCAIM